MRYTNLPPVGSLALPELELDLTWNHSKRTPGVQIEEAFAHRWGITNWQQERLDGIIREFRDPASEASSHIIYAGEVGLDKGRCVQGVRLADKAWTEGADNSEGVSVECGDAMWLGHDRVGFARAARIFGWLCLHEDLPALWVKQPHTTHYKGISRHADGGIPDGGHTQCPTTDLELFGQFVYRIKVEMAHGGYRKLWAV